MISHNSTNDGFMRGCLSCSFIIQNSNNGGFMRGCLSCSFMSWYGTYNLMELPYLAPLRFLGFFLGVGPSWIEIFFHQAQSQQSQPQQLKMLRFHVAYRPLTHGFRPCYPCAFFVFLSFFFPSSSSSHCPAWKVPLHSAVCGTCSLCAPCYYSRRRRELPRHVGHTSCDARSRDCV